MAYVAGEFLLTVRGNLPTGEIFDNVWCVIDQTGAQDPQDAVDSLHQFYTDIKGMWKTTVNANQCTIKSLLGAPGYFATWSTITGTATTDLLPTECAVRLSFATGIAAARGGPFLAGFAVGVMDSDGTLSTTSQNTLLTALTNLATNLGTDNWNLQLHRPSVSTTIPVNIVRVGQVFDAIRRRRNASVENFVSANI